MHLHKILIIAMLGFLLGALAVGYGQQRQNEARDRVYDAIQLSNLHREWRNDHRERNNNETRQRLVRREQELDQLERINEELRLELLRRIEQQNAAQ